MKSRQLAPEAGEASEPGIAFLFRRGQQCSAPVMSER